MLIFNDALNDQIYQRLPTETWLDVFFFLDEESKRNAFRAYPPFRALLNMDYFTILFKMENQKTPKSFLQNHRSNRFAIVEVPEYQTDDITTLQRHAKYQSEIIKELEKLQSSLAQTPARDEKTFQKRSTKLILSIAIDTHTTSLYEPMEFYSLIHRFFNTKPHRVEILKVGDLRYDLATMTKSRNHKNSIWCGAKTGYEPKIVDLQHICSTRDFRLDLRVSFADSFATLRKDGNSNSTRPQVIRCTDILNGLNPALMTAEEKIRLLNGRAPILKEISLIMLHDGVKDDNKPSAEVAGGYKLHMENQFKEAEHKKRTSRRNRSSNRLESSKVLAKSDVMTVKQLRTYLDHITGSANYKFQTAKPFLDQTLMGNYKGETFSNYDLFAIPLNLLWIVQECVFLGNMNGLDGVRGGAGREGGCLLKPMARLSPSARAPKWLKTVEQNFAEIPDEAWYCIWKYIITAYSKYDQGEGFVGEFVLLKDEPLLIAKESTRSIIKVSESAEGGGGGVEIVNDMIRQRQAQLVYHYYLMMLKDPSLRALLLDACETPADIRKVQQDVTAILQEEGEFEDSWV
ncbi:hypothetical protein WICPIJ_000231 [Wickerhamomyces pijperi]|uniref:Uncharacterized protein n=1 Tax=Wickerhamomyces pijperi TaxID=599730 RepID=A0A9P8QD11_WICPI|nr:hypothetical protein WICPIJ_000231 [Wickerhamomyces pijperi]